MEAVGQGILLEWSFLCIFGSIENAIDNFVRFFFLPYFAQGWLNLMCGII